MERDLGQETRPDEVFTRFNLVITPEMFVSDELTYSGTAAQVEKMHKLSEPTHLTGVKLLQGLFECF